MADAGSGEERIADLQREWQESPTPRVGLQLAEEHRRLGRYAEARAVLERSLEAHPGHLSSLVALGKTLLDLGEADAAAANFQRVVERDPTHLVAGKLLIEAHLRRGDRAAARERLDLYRLLNGGDPEIDELENRWWGLEEPGAEEAADRVAEPPPAAPAAPATADSVAAASGEAAKPFEPAPPERVRPDRPESGAREPFGLLAGAGDERRWLAGLAGDGIFEVALPPEPEPEIEPEPAGIESEPETEPESEVEPEPDPETAPEPPLAAAEPPAAAGEERATNTLGELYLAQGHLADAGRVFRAVLARRPDDPAARAGLAEVESRRTAPLTAGALLEWARDRGERLPGGDRRERSAVLLRTYLARLRRRSPADVP